MTAKTPALPEILTFTFEPMPGIRREMKVRTPDEGQLAVWAASAERFQTLGSEWAAQSEALAGRDEDDPDVLAFRQQRNEQATRALSRAMRIITTALVEQADRDWIEDGLLDRRFGLAEALGLISSAVDELRRLKASGTVAAPTTGPKTKTRRV